VLITVISAAPAPSASIDAAVNIHLIVGASLSPS
jgi:hypothetical protein